MHATGIIAIYIHAAMHEQEKNTALWEAEPQSVLHGVDTRGGAILTAKIALARLVLVAKVIRGPVWASFCQIQSGQTNFRGTDFGVTRKIRNS